MYQNLSEGNHPQKTQNLYAETRHHHQRGAPPTIFRKEEDQEGPHSPKVSTNKKNHASEFKTTRKNSIFGVAYVKTCTLAPYVGERVIQVHKVNHAVPGCHLERVALQEGDAQLRWPLLPAQDTGSHTPIPCDGGQLARVGYYQAVCTDIPWIQSADPHHQDSPQAHGDDRGHFAD